MGSGVVEGVGYPLVVMDGKMCYRGGVGGGPGREK